MISGVSTQSGRKFDSVDEFLSHHAVQPYRFDQAACTEPMTGIIHAFAITAAIANRWQFSMVASWEEVAKMEREAAAWNHSVTGYHGD